MIFGGPWYDCVHDFEGHQTYSEKPGHRFAINTDFDSIDPSVRRIMIPGVELPSISG